MKVARTTRNIKWYNLCTCLFWMLIVAIIVGGAFVIKYLDTLYSKVCEISPYKSALNVVIPMAVLCLIEIIFVCAVLRYWYEQNHGKREGFVSSFVAVFSSGFVVGTVLCNIYAGISYECLSTFHVYQWLIWGNLLGLSCGVFVVGWVLTKAVKQFSSFLVERKRRFKKSWCV